MNCRVRPATLSDLGRKIRGLVAKVRLCGCIDNERPIFGVEIYTG